MAAELGSRPVLCAFNGGETGRVLRSLLGDMPTDLRLIETTQENGAYLHDRRSGEREPIAQRVSPRRSRRDTARHYGLR